MAGAWPLPSFSIPLLHHVIISLESRSPPKQNSHFVLHIAVSILNALKEMLNRILNQLSLFPSENLGQPYKGPSVLP